MERKGKITWNPMPGRIVVLPLKEETVGGIWLPSDKSLVLGEVLEVGGDEPEGDMDFPVGVGDTVLFASTSGVKVRIDREEVRIFRTSEILAAPTWEGAAPRTAQEVFDVSD